MSQVSPWLRNMFSLLKNSLDIYLVLEGMCVCFLGLWWIMVDIKFRFISYELALLLAGRQVMNALYLQQELGLEDSPMIFSSKSGIHPSLSYIMS